jgi:hypothetical protein
MLSCVLPDSGAGPLTRPAALTAIPPGDASVVFRLHGDGRVTFEGRGSAEGARNIIIRGERISTATRSSSFG